MAANVSHGRGGAANIKPDDTVYADGGIVREGAEGDQGDGKYSAGRGGQGNIGGEVIPSTAPHDEEIVPETATMISKEQSHHVGRGGAGNEFHVHDKHKKENTVEQDGFEKKVAPHESIGNKVKEKIHDIFGKKDKA